VKKGETKEMTLATARFVSQDMLTDPFFSFPFFSFPFSLFQQRMLNV